MDVKKLEQAKQWVEKELASSAEFWLKYGMDKEHGGVYTCIDRHRPAVLHRQERVDAGPLRLDLRLPVPRVRQAG